MHNEYFMFTNKTLFSNGTNLRVTLEYLSRQPTDMDFEKLCEIYQCGLMEKQCKRQYHLFSNNSFEYNFQDISVADSFNQGCIWTFTTDPDSMITLDLSDALKFCGISNNWINQIEEPMITNLCSYSNEVITSAGKRTEILFKLNAQIARQGFTIKAKSVPLSPFQSLGVSCDFDGSICKWFNIIGVGNTAWKPYSKSVTINNNVIEPPVQGDSFAMVTYSGRITNASLESPWISNSSGYQCLSFYAMEGYDYGFLNLYLFFSDGAKFTFWRNGTSSRSGNDWELVNLRLNFPRRSDQNFKFQFSSILGPNVPAAAIANVVLSRNPCTPCLSTMVSTEHCLLNEGTIAWTETNQETSRYYQVAHYTPTLATAIMKMEIQEEVRCFSFRYRIFNVTGEPPSLEIKATSGRYSLTLFHSSKISNYAWAQAYVSLKNLESYYLTISANFHSGQRGQVNIDELSFDHISPCAGSGSHYRTKSVGQALSEIECDFERTNGASCPGMAIGQSNSEWHYASDERGTFIQAQNGSLSLAANRRFNFECLRLRYKIPQNQANSSTTMTISFHSVEDTNPIVLQTVTVDEVSLGSVWRDLAINVSRFSNYQPGWNISFEIGQGTNGHFVALDDLSLLSTTCPYFIPNTFDFRSDPNDDGWHGWKTGNLMPAGLSFGVSKLGGQINFDNYAIKSPVFETINHRICVTVNYSFVLIPDRFSSQSDVALKIFAVNEKIDNELLVSDLALTYSRANMPQVHRVSISGGGPIRIIMKLDGQQVPLFLLTTIESIGFSYELNCNMAGDRIY